MKCVECLLNESSEPRCTQAYHHLRNDYTIHQAPISLRLFYILSANKETRGCEGFRERQVGARSCSFDSSGNHTGVSHCANNQTARLLNYSFCLFRSRKITQRNTRQWYSLNINTTFPDISSSNIYIRKVQKLKHIQTTHVSHDRKDNKHNNISFFFVEICRDVGPIITALFTV